MLLFLFVFYSFLSAVILFCMADMKKRRAGILLHITSLPSDYGIGDLGENAYKFVDSLADSKVGLWQMLPVGPTGYGDSPYAARSAFAGNELLISPRLLYLDGYLSIEDAMNKAPETERAADTAPGTETDREEK